MFNIRTCRGYTAFEPDLLAELVKIFDRPAIKGRPRAVGSGSQAGGYFVMPKAMKWHNEGTQGYTASNAVGGVSGGK